MVSYFTINSFFILLGCVVLGIIYARLLYGSTQYLDKKLKLILATLRSLAITLTAWLLFAPLIKAISYHLEKPIVVLANDNSISVNQFKPKGFDQKKYEADLMALRDKLAGKYEVKTYHFSDSVKPGLQFSNNGKLTNATALVDQLNNELVNRNVGAVIMATDGIFNCGGNPLYGLAQLKSPVYTIALGDIIPKTDVLIANINYNNLVYLDNDFFLDVQLQAFESKGAEVKLSVSENGNQVFEQKITINAQNFVKDVQVKLKAKKTGVQRYTVNVSGVKNEIAAKNNTQTIFVEVIDGRQKILMITAGPHPDISVIAQALVENKHYQMDVVMTDELANQQVDKYSLAILYQTPAANADMQKAIGKIQESHMPIWYILGAQTNLTLFNQMQKNVNLSKNAASLQEIFGYPAENFTLFTLEETWMKQFSDYDPLLMPFANTLIKGRYTAVLNQRIGKINTQSPLWFFLDDNGKKLAYLTGEGLWKWKLEEAKDQNKKPLVNELISKTIQYLAAKDDKRKFRVYSVKNTFDENEQIALNGVLYNDSYQSVNTPDVKLQLKNSKGKIYNYTFSKSGNAYILNLGNLPQDNYTYTANTLYGDKAYIAKGAFYVNALVAEYQQTTANHQLLNTMAAQTGGKMVAPKNLLSIADDLEKSDHLKTISYEDHRYEQLINVKWLFALIITLLSIEWFFRKRNGEI